MAESENPVQNRRVTRRAFSEMPVLNDPQSLENFRGGASNLGNNMPNPMTPSSSPDELVIQRRGRREIPVIFSPDIDIIKQNHEESTPELGSSLNKSSIVLRSTPRKRLLYDLLDTPSPEKYNDDSSNPKRPRHEPKVILPENICFLSAMKALSSDQLISIVRQIVDDHPEIEKEIRSNFPIADLQPRDEHIHNLLRNIYKCLPSSRLISKTDPIAYYKVAMHVLEFKKYVIDQGRLLVESKLWLVVMNYVFMAWNHVRNTPIWDLPSHNAARRQCFKSLSEICLIALKNMKDTLDEQTIESYNRQLKLMCDDSSEDIMLCLEQLSSKLNGN